MDNICLLIDIEKTCRIQKFINRKDKIRTLIAEILVRTIIIEKLNISNNYIMFGRNQYIAREVMFYSSSHEIGDESRRASINIGKEIIIGDGCWVCVRAMILPSVVIGNGCIIAAGAIVTKECEANSLYAGIPAKKIRSLR